MEFDYDKAVKHVTKYFNNNYDAVLAGYTLACLSIMKDNKTLKCNDPNSYHMLDEMKEKARDESYIPYLICHQQTKSDESTKNKTKYMD